MAGIEIKKSDPEIAQHFPTILTVLEKGVNMYTLHPDVRVE